MTAPRRLRDASWLLVLVVTACSTRNCDNDALRDGFGGQGGDVSVGGSGGTAVGIGTGGTGVGGSVGGGPPGVDCDGDEVPEDLATDPSHCGSCGHVCTVTDSCLQGNCVLVRGETTNPIRPQGIDADADEVVFIGTSQDALTLFKVPPAGGAVEKETPSQSIGTVIGMDLHMQPTRFVLNAPNGFVAFVPRDDIFAFTLEGVGTNPVQLAGTSLITCWSRHAPDMPSVQCANGDTPFEAFTVASNPSGIAMDGGLSYWVADGVLWRSDPNPDVGTPTVVSAEVPGDGPLAIDGNDAYVVSAAGVWRRSLAGGSGSIIATLPATLPVDVIIVGSFLYVSTVTEEAGVYRVDVDDGTVEPLYLSESGPLTGYITAFGNDVFFGLYDDDVVLRHRIGSAAFGGVR